MSNILDSIYALTPVNKQAAVSVSQSGCSDSLTLEQERESLKDRWNQLNELLSSQNLSKKDPKRLKIGADLRVICDRLSEINSQIKKKPRRVDISPFFLLAAKEVLTKFEYQRIMKKALENAEENEWSTDNMKRSDND